MKYKVGPIKTRDREMTYETDSFERYIDMLLILKIQKQFLEMVVACSINCAIKLKLMIPWRHFPLAKVLLTKNA